MWFDKPPPAGRKKNNSASVTQIQIQKLIKGGRIADNVHARERLYHQTKELPEAEKEITDALDNWPEKQNPSLPSAAEEMHAPVKQTFWNKIFPFFSDKT